MNDPYDNEQTDREAYERSVLGERAENQTGKAEAVTPEDPSPRTVAKAVQKAVQKRAAAKAPSGGVYVVYDNGVAVQVYSSEVKALRYAAENGFKVKQVGYGVDLS